MSESDRVVELPRVAPGRLALAVQAAVTGRTSSAAWIRAGAEQSAREQPTDPAMARRFQTLLELGYLVASADGFADEERASLAHLLERVTGAALDHAALELHFRDLDEGVAQLGRRERLARTAADIESEAAAEEAIALVCMIALADGVLSAAEHEVLLELGRHTNLSPERVHLLVREAADRIEDGFEMTYVNHMAREVNCKIVYYGPGLGGKTTNLEHMYGKVREDARGKMVTLATETERTLFFDFMPLDLGTVKGFKVRLHLYTVPGQVFYDASRRLVLRGADGVVFVADSQPSRSEANIESLSNLEVNLGDTGQKLSEMAYVVQYNKRDIADVMSIDQMQADLNPIGAPYFEAAAAKGTGVFDTLKGLSKLVLQRMAF